MISAATAIVLALFSLLISLYSGSTEATPVAINLGNSNSLPMTLPAATIMPFDVGVNTVSGYADYYAMFPPNFVINGVGAFAFEIPDGAKLSSASFNFVLHPDQGTNIANLGFELREGNDNIADVISTTNIDLLTVPGSISLLSSGLQLSAGIYGVDNNLLGVNAGGGWYATYEFNFLVQERQQVSEPITMALLLVGGLGMFVRKPKSTE